MRLDFNVLWVDDQPEAVGSQITAIRKRMEAEGFQFNPTVCRSAEEVRAAISTSVFTDEVDLILVDWDLGTGARGQDVIADIRSSAQFKDVVLYSAQTAPDALRKTAFDRGLEGVYCATREQLVDDVMGVFDSLVKKVLDLDHTRGIVMGATSDIDNMVNECLAAIHEKLDDAGQRALVEQALKRIEEKLKDWTKDVDKLRKKSTMTAVLKAHLHFTAYDKLRMLSQVLEGEQFKAHASAGAILVKYIKEVQPERTKLAHLVLVAKGKPQLVVNVAGQEVGLEEMRDLRRLILGVRQDFRSLLDALRRQPEAASSGPEPGETK